MTAAPVITPAVTAPPAIEATPGALRRELRRRRRALPAVQRRKAALALVRRILRRGWLTRARHLGLYVSMDEEIDTTPLRAAAAAHGCLICLPRITRYRDNRMGLFDGSAPLRRSRWGIPEPQTHRARALRTVDVLFMPLVGFDAHGNRIGMGKGYYDRMLAARKNVRWFRRPTLVGLAYDCQQVASIESRPHDVPLDFIVTESRLLRFSHPMTPGHP